MYQIFVVIISLLTGVGLVALYKKYCSDDRADVNIVWFLSAGIVLFLLLVFYDLRPL